MTGVGLGWVGRSRRLLPHFSVDQAVEGAGSRAEPAARHDLGSSWDPSLKGSAVTCNSATR